MSEWVTEAETPRFWFFPKACLPFIQSKGIWGRESLSHLETQCASLLWLDLWGHHLQLQTNHPPETLPLPLRTHWSHLEEVSPQLPWIQEQNSMPRLHPPRHGYEVERLLSWDTVCEASSLLQGVHFPLDMGGGSATLLTSLYWTYSDVPHITKWPSYCWKLWIPENVHLW